MNGPSVPDRPGGGSWPAAWDEALAKLENFLRRYPQDRALPDPQVVAEQADVPVAFLREDERARKVLVEAVAVRPLSDREQVAQLRTEVELLTLEVEVLIDRLADLEPGAPEARRAARRLRLVRRHLHQLCTKL